MRTIKAQKLDPIKFAPYGTYFDVLHPEGQHLGGFYHDHLIFPVSGVMPMAYSSLVIDKPERIVIDKDEYHNDTGELSLCLDDDVVIHVTTASSDPHPQDMEAFIVPRGTLVAIKAGVFHMCSYPVTLKRAHILIGLPERTYKRDCVVVGYSPADQVEIEI
jgi:ureidoglycolate lyase